MAYSGGSGTAADPYVLATKQDVMDFFKYPSGHAWNSVYAEIHTDVDFALGDSFRPTGDTEGVLSYRAYLDFRGHKFTNFANAADQVGSGSYFFNMSAYYGYWKNGEIVFGTKQPYRTYCASFFSAIGRSDGQAFLQQMKITLPPVSQGYSYMTLGIGNSPALWGASGCLFIVPDNASGSWNFRTGVSGGTYGKCVDCVGVMGASIPISFLSGSTNCSTFYQSDVNAVNPDSYVEKLTGEYWVIDGANYPFITAAPDSLFSVSGTVLVDGVAATRSVVLTNARNRATLQHQYSDPDTGAFEFAFKWIEGLVMVHIYDDPGAAPKTETAYALDDLIQPPERNGYRYRCISPGTSDTSLPAAEDWAGGQVVLGGATFQAEKVNQPEIFGPVTPLLRAG